MTDLGDFGGGVDKQDPNPEDEVKQLLSEWLRGEGRTIYWEHDKTYGNGTFSVTSRRKPDLVIKGKTRNYAVEVKIGNDSGNIHDGAYQTFEYWKEIVDGDVEYSADSESIDIDAVLLGTQYSPEGHLFHSQRQKDVRRHGRSESAQKGVKFGKIPQYEHATSETLIRLLHRFARGYDDEAEVGIGGLLSSALDNDEPTIDSADPAALFYTQGASHVQKWEYIPFYLKD